MREKQGHKLPDPPKYSYTANSILSAYNTIARSRRYEQGTPLALSIADVNTYCDLYEPPVERYIFNTVIFDLDNQFIDKAYKRVNKKLA